MFRESKYGRIFFLVILCLSLIPKNQVQAATSTSYDFYNEFGTSVEVTTIINTVYPRNGANNIDFRARLDSLRPGGVSIYSISASFRIGSHELGSTSLPSLTSIGSTVYGSSSFDYDSSWGQINLEIKITWIEEIIASDNIYGETDWVVVFTLKPGSFITDNYYILIIVGVVGIGGIFVGVMIYRNRKMSKSDVEALEISKQMEEEVMLTSPEKHTLSETEPKPMKFCPHCVADLKGATGTCPNCGAKLE